VCIDFDLDLFMVLVPLYTQYICRMHVHLSYPCMGMTYEAAGCRLRTHAWCHACMEVGPPLTQRDRLVVFWRPGAYAVRKSCEGGSAVGSGHHRNRPAPPQIRARESHAYHQCRRTRNKVAREAYVRNGKL
jgi:hypothetical protein